MTNTAALDDGIIAIGGLSRALGGQAVLADVGSLLWVLLRQVVPCDTMAMFTSDEARDQVVVRYAAGAHAGVLEGIARPRSTGIAGWVAQYRRPVVNAEPILDLGFRASIAPALRSSLVVPLVEDGALVAILALYSTQLLAFTDDHAEMLDVLGPRIARTLGDAVVERPRRTPETPVLRPAGGAEHGGS